MTLTPEDRRVMDVIKEAEDRLAECRESLMWVSGGTFEFSAAKLSQIIDIMDYVLRDFDFKEAGE